MVMVSLERYTATRPGQQNWLTRGGTGGGVALLTTFSVLFNLPKIWELETCVDLDPDGNSNYSIKAINDQLRLQFSEIYYLPSYTLWYSNGGNVLVHFVIPLISLVYLNVSIYRRVSSDTND